MIDILMVVRNKLEMTRNCIDSIKLHTVDYNLFVWDNASEAEVTEYLKSQTPHYHRSEENLGFIIPNNRLITYGNAPYVILLNNDTVVKPNWDKALLNVLQTHPDVGVVGYDGKDLNDKYIGINKTSVDVAYVSGWCMCFSRLLYEEIGLFDEKTFEFAYCEDADFCLRVKKHGKRVYALEESLVDHFGGGEIIEEKAKIHYHLNHKKIREKWHARADKI